MSTDNDSSSSWIDTGFIDRYLDYLEGETTEPPTFDGLSDIQRRGAEAWVGSITTARGIDPYAQKPSIERLMELLGEVEA